MQDVILVLDSRRRCWARRCVFFLKKNLTCKQLVLHFQIIRKLRAKMIVFVMWTFSSFRGVTAKNHLNKCFLHKMGLWGTISFCCKAKHPFSGLSLTPHSVLGTCFVYASCDLKCWWLALALNFRSADCVVPRLWSKVLAIMSACPMLLQSLSSKGFGEEIFLPLKALSLHFEEKNKMKWKIL